MRRLLIVRGECAEYGWKLRRGFAWFLGRASLLSVEAGPISGRSLRPTGAPRAPFQDWPVQITTSVGYIWYTSPGVFVSQMLRETATVEDARVLTDSVDRVVAGKRADFTAHGGLLILHDWRILKSYDAAARSHLFAHTRNRKKGDVRGIIVSLTLTPLLRMAVEAGNALLTATTGRSVEIVPAISVALGKHRVQAPTNAAELAGLFT